ncbi:MAG TPA: ABC transporter substrate-binding protein [Thermomicrobiales bacterium]|nr:ABC transporter substrate-binding protein [Thermomicrobiales bacterium]
MEQGGARIRTLVKRLRAGEVDRRTFLKSAAMLGITSAAANLLVTSAAAQNATPAGGTTASPAAGGDAIRSITRDEYYAQLAEAYPLEAPENPGGTFIHTYTTDIKTLNPIIASDVYSQSICGWIYEGLVGNSLIDGSIVPSGLADSWEIAPDGVTYTLYLNPAVVWHDGTPFTADDVIFTFDAVVAEDSPSIRTSLVTEALASYRKVDDHTVELVSKEQSAMFLNNTANLFAIMPRHVWGDVPLDQMAADDGSTGQDVSRVVGTGPFRFVQWDLGAQVKLARNDDYWDQERVPVIDEYIFNVVQDENTQVASLKSGESDFIAVGSSQIDSLKQSNPDLQYASYDTGVMEYFFFNLNPDRTDMFTDVRVRQALQYALDKDVFVEAVMHGYGVKAAGTQPPFSPAFAPDQLATTYNYDVEKAASLLDEAGWVLGDNGVRERDGKPFSFKMGFASDPLYRDAFTFIQQYWREIGVQAEADQMPFTTHVEQLDAGDFDAGYIEFVWGSDGFQGRMFYCDSLPPNGFNWMGYCNEEYDQLDHEAMVELDADRRTQLLIDASNVINDDQAVGVLAFKRSNSAAQPRVHNFLPNGYSGTWWIQYTWFDAN